MSALYQDVSSPSSVLLPDSVYSSSYGSSSAQANRRELVHGWVPWIGGFSASFARACILDFCKDGLVYDPFAGVGTTLLSAMEARRDAIGIELNPYAALACKLKCSVSRLDLHKADRMSEEIRSLTVDDGIKWPYPSSFGTRRPFFSNAVWRKAERLLSWLQGENSLEYDLARLAFGATLVGFSNYSYEPSLSSRVGAGKPEVTDADVFTLVADKLKSMVSDARLWCEANGSNSGDASILAGNSLEMIPVQGRRVSLVMTSPPYLNNYHYVRNTRPQLYFLSLAKSTSDLRGLQLSNFGGYWQDLRDASDVDAAFNSSQILSTILKLRQVELKPGSYSGAGWARYATRYFNDTTLLIQNLGRFLSQGSHIVLILGNSVIQGVHFAVDRMVADIATENGLRVEGIARVRERVQGNKLMTSSVRSIGSNEPLYESMVVIKKQ